ncbi:MAG TPA: AbrB/MazE/SpoVT family DNA-binding domain-containing protein [Chloroflexota bacterium]|nr:AbrB/MazE/SpoVT family DNA-binding domain-containing protein [Chloroflexota bacterium]
MDDSHRVAEVLASYTTNADKIRALAGMGWQRADIARALGVRYQQVRNVLFNSSRAPPGSEPPNQGPIRVQVTEGGRIVIPAALRTALGIKVGDQVLLQLESDGAVRLFTARQAVRRAQELVRQYIPEGGRSLSEELVAERRREAESE